MTKERYFKDRREHERFKVKKGAFAVSSPKYNKLGQIKDISKGGLAFLYIGDEEPIGELVEIEIFSTFDDFYLRKLPVKIVLDLEVDKHIAFKSLPTRQLSMQFSHLSHSQRVLLRHFLRKYTYR